MDAEAADADAAAVRRVQDGDPRGVAELYDRHGAAAFGLARRITGDAALAEDVVQEAFIAMWRQAARFDPARGNMRSWLMTIVHHRAIDAVRRRTGRSERALETTGDRASDEHGRPDEMVAATLDAEAVRDAIGRIPAEQRTVIELAYFEGLTHVEIAAREGIPTGTVKSRMRLGLEKMREYLRLKVIG